MEESLTHEHNQARDSYLDDQGLMQPRPAPRFVDTETVMPRMWQPDSDRASILRELGIEEHEKTAKRISG
jgi:alpha-methylacyl-CoA racemase